MTTWSTNGTFVWPTSDKARISREGHLIALTPYDDEGHSGTKQARDRCELIVRAVNSHKDLLAALRKCDRNMTNLFTPFANDIKKRAPGLWQQFQEARDGARAALTKAQPS